MISPAKSMDPVLIPQLNCSQKGLQKEKVLFMRRAHGLLAAGDR